MDAAITKKSRDQSARKKPYHKGNVPKRLMEAAEQILETETLEDITARRLCREVGVTSANFYNHYPSLNYLLLEIASKGFESRVQMMKKLIKSDLPRNEKMVICAVKTVDLNLKKPQLFRLMFGYSIDPLQNANYAKRAEMSLASLTHIVYGEDIYRVDDVIWSHENCKKAYAFMSFIYGLAGVISTQRISNPLGTRKAVLSYVEDLTQTYLAGVDA